MGLGVGVGEGIGQAGANLLQALIARDERDRSEAAIGNKLMLPILAQAEQNKLQWDHEIAMENMRTERENAQKEFAAEASFREKQMDLSARLQSDEQDRANALQIAMLNAQSKTLPSITAADTDAWKSRIQESLRGEDYDKKLYREVMAKIAAKNQYEATLKAEQAGKLPRGSTKRLAERGGPYMKILGELEGDKLDAPGWFTGNLANTSDDRLTALGLDSEMLRDAVKWREAELAEKKVGGLDFSRLINAPVGSESAIIPFYESTLDSLLADTSATGIPRSVDEEIYGMPEVVPEEMPIVSPSNDPRARQDAEYNAIMGE